MSKAQRLNGGNTQLEIKSYDRISFGDFKGRTVGWMADNAPVELEAWAAARKGYFSRDIQDRINAAKNLLR